MAISNKIREYTLIAGPTASGKSDLALKIAAENDGVVINTDALQVYECYEVLTARPPKEHLEIAPHKLYGHIHNPVSYSVGMWIKDVQEIVESSDQPLIFVGGTGLYFHALLQGLVDIPNISPEIRSQLSLEASERGLEALVQELKQVDPVSFKQIDIQNSRRVIRALEVFRQTGKSLSSWQFETPPPMLKIEECEAIVVVPDVATTNLRIEHRFDQMLALGAIEEVAEQSNPWNDDLPANKALGAKPIAQYLKGEIPLEQARDISITSTKQYAKRQRSWFRSRMKSWNWVNSSD